MAANSGAPSRRLIIFAKAPIPGEAKTRLAPALGNDGAAMLHAALVERALETATRSQLSVELCASPSSAHTFFRECAEDWNVALGEQGDGDLGQRMLGALMRGLSSFEQVAILGADCPAMTSPQINAAFDALTHTDVALIPADDGGYVLIAAKRVDARMFDAIAWGSASVLASQCKALDACSLTHTLLAPLWDVDRPEDLARLKALQPPLAFFWPTQ
jgi:uncharacterized protein